MKQIPLTSCLILILTPFALAQLTVVEGLPGDFAQTDLRVFDAQMNGGTPNGLFRAEVSLLSDEAWMLPISSSRLSPGKITPRTLDMPGLPPFFLVGDDPKSLAWLQERGTVLRELGTVGLAVEVADLKALARIRAAAPGITILPLNGNSIATRLQIKHYPVLVTATSLEQ
ncbi:integrating conjugative element protein [Pseudomonas veronii]